MNQYDENFAHRFQLFFAVLTRKTSSNQCSNENLLDCNDSYCVHESSRCNGIAECQTKIDETFCQYAKSNSLSQFSDYLFYYFVYILTICAVAVHGQSSS